jgi:hypothetical protein
VRTQEPRSHEVEVLFAKWCEGEIRRERAPRRGSSVPSPAALVVVHTPASPVLEIAARGARATKIRGEHEDSKRKRGWDDHTNGPQRETPRQRLANRPCGADEDEA